MSVCADAMSILSAINDRFQKLTSAIDLAAGTGK
jgi:hypothetical protein